MIGVVMTLHMTGIVLVGEVPEPDFYAEKKILFAGGSMTLGTGVPC